MAIFFIRNSFISTGIKVLTLAGHPKGIIHSSASQKRFIVFVVMGMGSVF